MKFPPHHIAFLAHALLAAAFLCAVTGCWETIEFKGTTSTTESTEQSTPPIAENDQQVNADADASAPVTTDSIATSEEPPVESPVSDLPVETTEPATSAATEESTSLPAASTDAPPTPPADTQDAPDPYAMPVDTAALPSDAPPAASDSPPPSDSAKTELATESSNVAASDQPASPNTRHEAWILGSRLSLAALANDRGVSAASVPKWFGEAKTAAESLGTTINELPPRAAQTDTAPASKAVLEYLLSTDGPRLGHHLQTRYGPDHAALLELGVKSSLLILLYTPDSKTVSSISKAIAEASPRAGLSADIYQPLIDLLGKASSISEVRNGVRQFHSEVDRFLTTPAEQ